ncbi:hypothetical protein ACFPRA_05090 [Sporosarcina soli]|uniref:Uncharacterized protein n=1 Tax=Sporosarcina soli TaxID=334736 RepID=A0ABW0THR6_9BACL
MQTLPQEVAILACVPPVQRTFEHPLNGKTKPAFISPPLEVGVFCS